MDWLIDKRKHNPCPQEEEGQGNVGAVGKELVFWELTWCKVLDIEDFV